MCACGNEIIGLYENYYLRSCKAIVVKNKIKNKKKSSFLETQWR